ncbi:MAG: hypothetical protein AAGF94_16400 [Pseudomonadota bacterium]
MIPAQLLPTSDADNAIALLEGDEMRRLDLLRAQAAGCRTAARLDLFQACSLLTVDPDKAPVVFARALLRTLGEALGKRPVIHGSGSPEISFDERWLLRLIERLEAGDTDSFTFLLSGRVPHEYRRSVAYLVHGVVAPPDRRMSVDTY